MRRALLLLAACLTASVVRAREPQCFELPCTVELGKFIVTVETRAGAGRFLFDTGASHTAVSESLCRVLALAGDRTTEVSDFDGFHDRLALVRLPWLRLGDAECRNLKAYVLPDTSYLVRCVGLDGIVGGDLLRRFVVRLTDSTVTLARDIRALGLDPGRAGRIDIERNRPFVRLRLRGGSAEEESLALFDSGSSGFFNCPYDECTQLIERQVLADVRRTFGRTARVGWNNRSAEREAVRAVVPELLLAGATLKRFPIDETHGRTGKLGTALLHCGEVAIDYPGRRFWFTPAAGAAPPEAVRYGVGFALAGTHLIVGQVWDEALEGLVAPGDRVIRIGSLDVSEVDPCTYICGELRPDKPEITVERSDGRIVVVPIRRL